MANLKRKLEAYVAKHGTDEPITLNALAKALSASKQTLYNNKEVLKESGLTIIHARAKKAQEVELPVLNSSNVDTAPLAKILFTTVHSFVSEYLVVPCEYLYSDDIRDRWLENRFSLTSAEIYLQRCLSAKNFLTTTEKISVSFLLDDIKFSRGLKFFKEDKDLATECFKQAIQHIPSEEQVKVIASVLRFIKKGGSSRFGRIQALAGASKTTILNILSKYLKTDADLTIGVIAPTRLASSCLKGGTTLHAYLDKLLDIKTVEMDEEHILRLVERSSAQGLLKQVDVLLVDEYTMFSPDLIRTIKYLAKCIIFSGDVGQNLNNTDYAGPLLGTLTYQYRFDKSNSDLQKQITKLRFRNDREGIDKLLKSTRVGTFKGLLKVEKEGNILKKRTDYTDSFNHLEDILLKYTGSEGIIVAYSKAAVTEVNKLINGGLDIKVGSKVTLIKTFHKGSICSGSLGKVLSINGNECTVLFENSKAIINKDDLTLAYAVTCISSQGSSWTNVLFVEGTSNKESYLPDTYVGTSRAEVNFNTITRSEVKTEINEVCDSLLMEEGSRNTSTYRAMRSLVSLAENKGLPMNEVVGITQSVLKDFGVSKLPKSPKVEAKATIINQPLIQNLNAYSYVLEPLDKSSKPLYPYSHQKNKSKAAAEYQKDIRLKDLPNFIGYLTFNLKGQPYIVYDFDNDVEGVNKFKHLLESTKGGINKDGTRMHLWFEVDTVMPTRHFKAGDKGIDVLGNEKETNVNFKPNKVFNNLEPMKLSKEILEQLETHLKITYNR